MEILSMAIVADVFNQAHEKVGTVELPARVFEATWAPRTVHQVVVSYLANQRNTVAHTKDRSEVRGGGRKPWKQKHTGRARHGSSRSPIWKGGGVTHGPLTARDFSKKVNDGMKRAALRAVLARKWKDGELAVVNTLVPASPKTKAIAALVRAFSGDKALSALLISAKPNAILKRAGRNIPKVETMSASDLHVYATLAHRALLIETKAIDVLKKRLA
ncbi:MAG: 50S ribosomal protein L4 [Candidatus Jorgensenbacteria bacterium]|nr:50S ribosomal protein L4 [Candidatus Jorgensenbacteria bacterium]